MKGKRIAIELGNANRGAVMTGLNDNAVSTKLGNGTLELSIRCGCRQTHARRHGNAVGTPNVLRKLLIHRNRRSRHARTGIGKTYAIEESLYGAVLAQGPVKRNKGGIICAFFQTAHAVNSRIPAFNLQAL